LRRLPPQDKNSLNKTDIPANFYLEAILKQLPFIFLLELLKIEITDFKKSVRSRKLCCQNSYESMKQV